MRVEHAILCRFAEINGGLATIVGGGIDTQMFDALPASVSSMLALKVVGHVEEFPGDHRLRCYATGPQEEQVGEIVDTTVSIPAEASEHVRQDWLVNVQYAIGVAFPAEIDGTYNVHISFGDAEFSAPVHVIVVPPESDDE